MSVSSQFFELNSLRPANARFGEVTSIDLRVTTFSGETYKIGNSKRKSIHVPPSSNAYWNWMCLRADLVKFCSEKGMNRQTRKAFYAALNDAVRMTHRVSLMQHYADEVKDATQYFDICLSETEAKVLDGALIVQSSIKEQDDDETLVYSACFVV